MPHPRLKIARALLSAVLYRGRDAGRGTGDCGAGIEGKT